MSFNAGYPVGMALIVVFRYARLAGTYGREGISKIITIHDDCLDEVDGQAAEGNERRDSMEPAQIASQESVEVPH